MLKNCYHSEKSVQFNGRIQVVIRQDVQASFLHKPFTENILQQ
jgi:hypothetical protein